MLIYLLPVLSSFILSCVCIYLYLEVIPNQKRIIDEQKKTIEKLKSDLNVDPATLQARQIIYEAIKLEFWKSMKDSK